MAKKAFFGTPRLHPQCSVNIEGATSEIYKCHRYTYRIRDVIPAGLANSAPGGSRETDTGGTTIHPAPVRGGSEAHTAHRQPQPPDPDSLVGRASASAQ